MMADKVSLRKLDLADMPAAAAVHRASFDERRPQDPDEPDQAEQGRGAREQQRQQVRELPAERHQ